MSLVILGGHSRWLSPLLHSWILLLSLQIYFLILHSGSSHSSIVFSKSYSDLCSSLQIAWLRNQTPISVSLGKTRWSMIESTMIFLALTKFFWCKAFSLISLWNWNLSTHVGVQFISSERSYTSRLGSFQLSQSCHQADVIDHFEMRTSNENSKILDLTDLGCPSLFWS